MNEINMVEVTVEDCMDMYEKKGKITVISNGCVISFEEEQA